MPRPCNLSKVGDSYKVLIYDLTIDFKLLRNQKNTLLDLANANVNSTFANTIEGVIGLIDEIQDQAAKNIVLVTNPYSEQNIERKNSE